MEQILQVGSFNVLGDAKPTAPKLKWLRAIIGWIGAVLIAILRGLRAVWDSSLRAAEVRERQLDYIDQRYRGFYYLR